MEPKVVLSTFEYPEFIATALIFFSVRHTYLPPTHLSAQQPVAPRPVCLSHRIGSRIFG